MSQEGGNVLGPVTDGVAHATQKSSALAVQGHARVGDRRIDSADALIAAIRSQRPGDEVTLTYVRGGQEQTVTVTLGSDG